MEKVIDNDNRLDDITFIKHLKEKNSIFLDDIAKVYNAVKDIPSGASVPNPLPNSSIAIAKGSLVPM